MACWGKGRSVRSDDAGTGVVEITLLPGDCSKSGAGQGRNCQPYCKHQNSCRRRPKLPALLKESEPLPESLTTVEKQRRQRRWNLALKSTSIMSLVSDWYRMVL